MKSNDCVPLVNDILVAKDGSYLKEIFICRNEIKQAILSSIAMSRSQLRLMMMIEVMFSFLISCILGGSLGLWLNKLVEKLLFGLGICINNNIDISKCLILILGVFVLLSLTSIVPMLRLRKIDVVEQIKNEG